MKNYSNQILKIKQTLDELKNNIEKMQLVIIIILILIQNNS
jgi:hypothetical protein